jgi:hypothetical protein
MKTIAKDESLKLLGLFTLASEHYSKAREFEFAMNRALGKDANDQGSLSDAIYQRDGSRSSDEFYAALRNEGFVVTDE